MKNQNDLIISIVAIVLALIIAGVCLGTKREPATIPAPETVNLSPAALPQGDVVMASSLPGGGSSGVGGGAGRPAPAGGSMMMAPAGPGGGARGGAPAPGAPGGKMMPGANGLAHP